MCVVRVRRQTLWALMVKRRAGAVGARARDAGARATKAEAKRTAGARREEETMKADMVRSGGCEVKVGGEGEIE